MINRNPTILQISNPVGYDKAIQEVQAAMATIPYIEKSFGRAFIHKENRAGKLVSLPKVYSGEKEYHNPLPNGELKASTFMVAVGEEVSEDFKEFEQNTFTRQTALIFWGNLKAIDPTKDYIFLEEIKMDVISALKGCASFKSYDKYIDERYSDVFPEFSSYLKNASKDTADDEINTQYLMYPYAGFRMTLTLTYEQPCI